MTTHSDASKASFRGPPRVSAERRAFYDLIGNDHLAPLWEVLRTLLPRAPQSPCVPAGWRYRDVRRHLEEAGRLVTAREAERRVLILENPALRGSSSLTQTLYAGIQLLLPGEVAPPHRHSQSALRLVLEGEGAYTSIDGENETMAFGDFIVTPSMTWHGHGNSEREPVVWLDGLDLPLVRFLDAGFAESSTHEATLRTDASSACFGANLAPLDYATPATRASPLRHYSFARTREALEASRTARDPDPWQGIALKFLNPTTGSSPIPTIGAYVQLLPAGFDSRPYRSTDGRIFCCLEGVGRVDIDGWTFDFGQRDIFVVPSWCAYRLRSSTDADVVMFSFSDRPVQEVLGLWREQRDT